MTIFLCHTTNKRRWRGEGVVSWKYVPMWKGRSSDRDELRIVSRSKDEMEIECDS